MDLPSARELELEVLLRQRETQLAELKVSERTIWLKIAHSEQHIIFSTYPG
jgi:hypothetical protein